MIRSHVKVVTVKRDLNQRKYYHLHINRSKYSLITEETLHTYLIGLKWVTKAEKSQLAWSIKEVRGVCLMYPQVNIKAWKTCMQLLGLWIIRGFQHLLQTTLLKNQMISSFINMQKTVKVRVGITCQEQNLKFLKAILNFSKLFRLILACMPFGSLHLQTKGLLFKKKRQINLIVKTQLEK